MFRVPDAGETPAPVRGRASSDRPLDAQRRGERVRQPPAQELPAPREVGAPHGRELLPGLRRRPARLRGGGRPLHGRGPRRRRRAGRTSPSTRHRPGSIRRGRSSASTTCSPSYPRFSASTRDDVFLKVRAAPARGLAVRAGLAAAASSAIVEEGGLLFEVNFSDYLDTGLFLDHRLTRGMDPRAGRRASASSTCSPTPARPASTPPPAARARRPPSTSRRPTWAGPSATWPRNGFSGAAAPPRAGRRAAVARRGRATPDARFDLIFCDPPTFSNSKRMQETWDVQRDHVSLIIRTAELLAPGGMLVFSCNRRKFAFDVEALDARGPDVRGRHGAHDSPGLRAHAGRTLVLADPPLGGRSVHRHRRIRPSTPLPDYRVRVSDAGAPTCA